MAGRLQDVGIRIRTEDESSKSIGQVNKSINVLSDTLKNRAKPSMELFTKSQRTATASMKEMGATAQDAAIGLKLFGVALGGVIATAAGIKAISVVSSTIREVRDFLYTPIGEQTIFEMMQAKAKASVGDVAALSDVLKSISQTTSQIPAGIIEKSAIATKTELANLQKIKEIRAGMAKDEIQTRKTTQEIFQLYGKGVSPQTIAQFDDLYRRIKEIDRLTLQGDKKSEGRLKTLKAELNINREQVRAKRELAQEQIWQSALTSTKGTTSALNNQGNLSEKELSRFKTEESTRKLLEEEIKLYDKILSLSDKYDQKNRRLGQIGQLNNEIAREQSLRGENFQAKYSRTIEERLQRVFPEAIDKVNKSIIQASEKIGMGVENAPFLNKGMKRFLNNTVSILDQSLGGIIENGINNQVSKFDKEGGKKLRRIFLDSVQPLQEIGGSRLFNQLDEQIEKNKEFYQSLAEYQNRNLGILTSGINAIGKGATGIVDTSLSSIMTKTLPKVVASGFLEGLNRIESPISGLAANLGQSLGDKFLEVVLPSMFSSLGEGVKNLGGKGSFSQYQQELFRPQDEIEKRILALNSQGNPITQFLQKALPQFLPEDFIRRSIGDFLISQKREGIQNLKTLPSKLVNNALSAAQTNKYLKNSPFVQQAAGFVESVLPMDFINQGWADLIDRQVEKVNNALSKTAKESLIKSLKQTKKGKRQAENLLMLNELDPVTRANIDQAKDPSQAYETAIAQRAGEIREKVISRQMDQMSQQQKRQNLLLQSEIEDQLSPTAQRKIAALNKQTERDLSFTGRSKQFSDFEKSLGRNLSKIAKKETNSELVLQMWDLESTLNKSTPQTEKELQQKVRELKKISQKIGIMMSETPSVQPLFAELAELQTKIQRQIKIQAGERVKENREKIGSVLAQENERIKEAGLPLATEEVVQSRKDGLQEKFAQEDQIYEQDRQKLKGLQELSQSDISYKDYLNLKTAESQLKERIAKFTQRLNINQNEIKKEGKTQRILQLENQIYQEEKQRLDVNVEAGVAKLEKARQSKSNLINQLENPAVSAGLSQNPRSLQMQAILLQKLKQELAQIDIEQKKKLSQAQQINQELDQKIISNDLEIQKSKARQIKLENERDQVMSMKEADLMVVEIGQKVREIAKKAGLEGLGEGIIKGFSRFDQEFGGVFSESFSFLAERAGIAFREKFGEVVAERLGTVLNGLDEGLRATMSTIESIPSRFTTGLDIATQGSLNLAGATEPLTVFRGLQSVVGGLVNQVSELGYQFMYFQQALMMLNQIVTTGPFKLLIGQNEELNQQLLSSRATIASTMEVISIGGEQMASTPLTAIAELERPVKAAIARIRRDSLELVGVTSSQLVELFQIVTQFVGKLDDASKLVTYFAGSLGAIGLPLYQARQEISSILSGTIDMNSVLAKTIGITNEMVLRWKTQGVLVTELTKRMESFKQANAIASNSISGIGSNISEVIENIGLIAGEELAKPIVARLRSIYNYLTEETVDASNNIVRVVRTDITQGVEEISTKIVNSLSKLFDSVFGFFTQFEGTFGSVLGYLGKSVTGFIDAVSSAITTTKQVLSPFIEFIQTLITYIRPLGGIFVKVGLTTLFIRKGIDVLAFSFGSLANALPVVGELLFGVNLRLNGLFNTIAVLQPMLGVGASNLLGWSQHLANIPGAIGAVTNALSPFLGVLAGPLASAIPLLAGLGIQFVMLTKIIPGFDSVWEGLRNTNVPQLFRNTAFILESGFIQKIPVVNIVAKAMGIQLRGVATSAQAVNANMTLASGATLLWQKVAQGAVVAAKQMVISFGLWAAGLYIGFRVFNEYIAKNKQIQEVFQGLGYWIGQLFNVITSAIGSIITWATEINPLILAVGGLVVAIVAANRSLLVFNVLMGKVSLLVNLAAGAFQFLSVAMRFLAISTFATQLATTAEAFTKLNAAIVAHNAKTLSSAELWKTLIATMKTLGTTLIASLPYLAVVAVAVAAIAYAWHKVKEASHIAITATIDEIDNQLLKNEELITQLKEIKKLQEVQANQGQVPTDEQLTDWNQKRVEGENQLKELESKKKILEASKDESVKKTIVGENEELEKKRKSSTTQKQVFTGKTVPTVKTDLSGNATIVNIPQTVTEYTNKEITNQAIAKFKETADLAATIGEKEVEGWSTLNDKQRFNERRKELLQLATNQKLSKTDIEAITTNLDAIKSDEARLAKFIKENPQSPQNSGEIKNLRDKIAKSREDVLVLLGDNATIAERIKENNQIIAQARKPLDNTDKQALEKVLTQVNEQITAIEEGLGGMIQYGLATEKGTAWAQLRTKIDEGIRQLKSGRRQDEATWVGNMQGLIANAKAGYDAGILSFSETRKIMEDIIESKTLDESETAKVADALAGLVNAEAKRKTDILDIQKELIESRISQGRVGITDENINKILKGQRAITNEQRERQKLSEISLKQIDAEIEKTERLIEKQKLMAVGLAEADKTSTEAQLITQAKGRISVLERQKKVIEGRLIAPSNPEEQAANKQLIQGIEDKIKYNQSSIQEIGEKYARLNDPVWKDLQRQLDKLNASRITAELKQYDEAKTAIEAKFSAVSDVINAQEARLNAAIAEGKFNPIEKIRQSNRISALKAQVDIDKQTELISNRIALLEKTDPKLIATDPILRQLKNQLIIAQEKQKQQEIENSINLILTQRKDIQDKITNQIGVMKATLESLSFNLDVNTRVLKGQQEILSANTDQYQAQVNYSTKIADILSGTLKSDRQKKQMAELTAAIKLEALQKEQQMQVANLAIERQQLELAQERARIAAEIATGEAKVELLDAQAKLDEAKLRTPNDTRLIENLTLQIQNKQTKLSQTQQNQTLLLQEQETERQVQLIKEQNAELSRSTASLTALSDLINSTASPAQRRRLQNQLQQSILSQYGFSDRSQFLSQSRNFSRGVIEQYLPQFQPVKDVTVIYDDQGIPTAIIGNRNLRRVNPRQINPQPSLTQGTLAPDGKTQVIRGKDGSLTIIGAGSASPSPSSNIYSEINPELEDIRSLPSSQYLQYKQILEKQVRDRYGPALDYYRNRSSFSSSSLSSSPLPLGQALRLEPIAIQPSSFDSVSQSISDGNNYLKSIDSKLSKPLTTYNITIQGDSSSTPSSSPSLENILAIAKRL